MTTLKGEENAQPSLRYPIVASGVAIGFSRIPPPDLYGFEPHQPGMCDFMFMGKLRGSALATRDFTYDAEGAKDPRRLLAKLGPNAGLIGATMWADRAWVSSQTNQSHLPPPGGQ